MEKGTIFRIPTDRFMFRCRCRWRKWRKYWRRPRMRNGKWELKLAFAGEGLSQFLKVRPFLRL
jgi:hypothetical protein